MGTNFYLKTLLDAGILDRDDPQVHIGKRSAAGLYCWDCGVTLCQSGISGIHRAGQRWLDRCPRCGQSPDAETMANSAVGLELGFARLKAKRPHGVRSCSSFSWAQDPIAIRKLCFTLGDEPVVVDEYGRVYTGDQFLLMLMANCPLQFEDSLGTRFL